MARTLHAWAINRGGKNSVRKLRYGPRTRLVRGIYTFLFKAFNGHLDVDFSQFLDFYSQEDRYLLRHLILNR